MKKVLQIASASIVGISMFAGVAGATASSCPDSTIENTGQGSNNSITCVTTNETHVTCVNDIYVVGINGQAAGSGNANSNGNTSGGVAVTGNATNDNNTVVQVGASCGAEVATVTPAVPVTPATPGKGAGAAVAETPQVVAPAGSVHAGAGGAPVKVSAASLAGVVGSAATLGLGVALRKKAFQS